MPSPPDNAKLLDGWLALTGSPDQFIDPVHLPMLTGSMAPRIPVGSELVIVSACRRPLGRGDVVVFKFPDNPRRDFIKRCVAVAGDRVEIRARRLTVARSVPLVRELRARIAAGREDVVELLRLLGRERERASVWPSAQLALDRFLEAAGLAELVLGRAPVEPSP